MIQATVAIYPLGQEGFRAVDRAIEALQTSGVEFEVRAMHTELRGEPGAVFDAIRAAYDAAAAEGGVVMTVSISNVCPLPRDA